MVLPAAFLTALTGVGMSTLGRGALLKATLPVALSGLAMGGGYGVGVVGGYNIAKQYFQPDTVRKPRYKYYGNYYVRRIVDHGTYTGNSGYSGNYVY